jgi:uncharacterized protein YyaL (SSP411 family)
MELQQHMLDRFWDEAEGGFYYIADDSEQLIVRDREIYDGAVPSSNSVAALNLLRLGRMAGKVSWEERGDQLLKSFSGLVSDYPSAYTQFLNAVDFALGPISEIVLVGEEKDPEARKMMEFLQGQFKPNSVLAFKRLDRDGDELSALVPFVQPFHSVGGKAAVYICENQSCRPPITGLEELKKVFHG